MGPWVSGHLGDMKHQQCDGGARARARTQRAVHMRRRTQQVRLPAPGQRDEYQDSTSRESTIPQVREGLYIHHFI